MQKEPAAFTPLSIGSIAEDMFSSLSPSLSDRRPYILRPVLSVLPVSLELVSCDTTQGFDCLIVYD
jgi:hypothetical protein